MPFPPLSVDTHPDGDRVILTCRGELDHFSAPTVRESVTDAVAAGWRRVVLDFSHLDFMDAGGVHLLEELRDGVLGDAEYAMVDGHAAVSLPIDMIGGPRLLPCVRLDP